MWEYGNQAILHAKYKNKGVEQNSTLEKKKFKIYQHQSYIYIKENFELNYVMLSQARIFFKIYLFLKLVLLFHEKM